MGGHLKCYTCGLRQHEDEFYSYGEVYFCGDKCVPLCIKCKRDYVVCCLCDDCVVKDDTFMNDKNDKTNKYACRNCLTKARKILDFLKTCDCNWNCNCDTQKDNILEFLGEED